MIAKRQRLKELWEKVFNEAKLDLQREFEAIEPVLEKLKWRDGTPPNDEILRLIAFYRFKRSSYEMHHQTKPENLHEWAIQFRTRSSRLRKLLPMPGVWKLEAELDEVFAEHKFRDFGLNSARTALVEMENTLKAMEAFCKILIEATSSPQVPAFPRKNLTDLNHWLIARLAETFQEHWIPLPGDRPMEETAGFIELIGEAFNIPLKFSTRTLRRAWPNISEN